MRQNSILGVMAYCAFQGQWDSVFVGMLAQTLLLVTALYAVSTAPGTCYVAPSLTHREHGLVKGLLRQSSFVLTGEKLHAFSTVDCPSLRYTC